MDEFVEPKARIETEFFLATVAEVDDEDGISIIPEGQTSATGKKYKMLINGGFTPEAGDRVVVLKQSGTFVILGKIGYPEDNTGGGGITYPISVDKGGTDATTAADARTNLGAAAAEDLDGKVAKAGDTMTGNLTLKNSNYTNGSVPSSNAWGDTYLRFEDSAETWLAVVRSYILRDGYQGLQMRARAIIEGGTSVDNMLRLEVGQGGELRIFVTDPAPWKEALGFVNLTGDTMTGGLTVENYIAIRRSSGNGLAIDDLAADATTTPSSTANRIPLVFRDQNGTAMGMIRARQQADGKTGLYFIGTNNGVNNYLMLLVDGNGNRTVSLNAQDAWLKALGLGSSAGALPITIDQGGSGQTAVTTTTTASQIVTAAANWSITSANYSQWGKLAMVYIRAKTTAQVTTTTTTTIMTIASGKRPVQAAPLRVWLSNSYQAVINTDGTVYMSNGTISANSEFTFIGTYLLA